MEKVETPSQYVYDSDGLGHPAVTELRELLRYKDLLRLLITNSVKTRYKRSTLGVLWTLLSPLMSTLVLTIAFSQVFRFQVQNYPVYILSGLVVWNFFAQTTSQSMGTLVWGSNLLKRIYTPRTIFAISVAGNGLINLFFATIPLLVIMLFMRQPFTLALLFLPVAVLIVAIFTVGFSLIMSTLSVFFVDVVELYTVMISAWFYMTPVIYPADILPEKLYPFLVQMNPLAIMVRLFRDPIYLGQIPPWPVILVGGAMALVSLIVGWIVFTSRADEFAYRI